MSVPFKVRFYFSFMRLTSVYLERNGNGQGTFQSVIQKYLGLLVVLSVVCFGLCPQPQVGLGCAGNTIVVSPS